MNIPLWILQVLGALLYGASGVMKVFLFDKVSADVPSFGALPRSGWKALGITELACSAGLIAPGVFGWPSSLTVAAAAVLAVESLVFIWVHVTYGEVTPIVFSGVLGAAMALIAYGRLFLAPIVLVLVVSAVPVTAQSAKRPPPFTVVEATIPEMQTAMRERRVTSRELVTQYLTRIALYDKRINAAIAACGRARQTAGATATAPRKSRRVRGMVRRVIDHSIGNSSSLPSGSSIWMTS